MLRQKLGLFSLVALLGACQLFSKPQSLEPGQFVRYDCNDGSFVRALRATDGSYVILDDMLGNRYRLARSSVADHDTRYTDRVIDLELSGNTLEFSSRRKPNRVLQCVAG
jgi:hypothetical protein